MIYVKLIPLIHAFTKKKKKRYYNNIPMYEYHYRNEFKLLLGPFETTIFNFELIIKPNKYIRKTVNLMIKIKRKSFFMLLPPN